MGEGLRLQYVALKVMYSKKQRTYMLHLCSKYISSVLTQRKDLLWLYG